MLIAPQADAADGLLNLCAGAQSEGWACFAHCRVFTMVLISNIRWLRAVRCVTWSSKRPAPADVMIDGEVATLQCRSLDVVPAAVDVFI